MTINDIIIAYNLSIDVQRVSSNPHMDDSTMSHYLCTICDNNTGDDMKVHFSMGSALKHKPTIEEVLDCLASGAAGYEASQDFEDWARDLGYDEDSR